MILAIASQKGGTGKTTTAISLAAGLAHRGNSVLLIDVDSQANSSKVLMPDYMADIQPDSSKTLYHTIIDRGDLPIHSTTIKNLEIVPSHILLSEADTKLSSAMDHRGARLRTKLAQIEANYDYVILDCPPALSWLTINALSASHKVLVTISPGYFELDSIAQLDKTLSLVRDDLNPELELAGYVFTMADPTVNSATSIKLLRDVHKEKVLQAMIPRNTDMRDAHMNKLDIFTFNPKAPGALAYSKLINELFYGEKAKRK